MAQQHAEKMVREEGRRRVLRLKTILKQMVCRHEIEQRVKKEEYSHLQGDTVYHVCRKCGKVVKEEFLTWEEQLARYGRYV